ncbi:response regulator [Halieaceae bacterium IMCC14734]|uniref:histidine kinase n=1 Tax=Candidatus Litorirhabdus singularis TaxID=2518993 RepID=A0ABT3TKI7_9GAMM|nr:response regulator [Candidatus Litorirhabdus singularis]MCX2982828.1 response regulator [Candidatus Litorirhabdus singularis]
MSKQCRARLSPLLLLLCVLVSPAYAVVVDDVAQPVSLAGQWQFKLGDDPAWAMPELDASQWQATAVPGHAPAGHAGYSGMLWFRLAVQLDTSKQNVRENMGRLAVSLGGVISAYEIYAGGIKLGGVGGLPPNAAAVYDKHATFSIPAEAIDADGRVVLALRVWRDPAIGSSWETGPHLGEYLLGTIGDLRQKQVSAAILPEFLLAVLYLVLGVYHLLIARRNPILKEFLWFGLLSLVLAGYTFETSQSKFFLDVPYLWHKKAEFVFLYIMPVVFANTLLGATRTPPNLMTHGFAVIFVLFFVTAVVLPLDLTLRYTLRPFQAIGALWAFSMAVMLGWRAYRGSRSAMGVVVLMMLLGLAVVNDVILESAILGTESLLYIVAALLIFLIALMMAERYTEILKQLEFSVEQRTVELVHANTELEGALATKGQFLAKMSHELRTPMNAILGLTRLGLATDLNPQQRDYFSKVESSAAGLQGIIDNVLDFSRLEDGELACAPIPFAPGQLVGDLSERWGVRAEEAGLTFNVSFDEQIPEAVLGDAVRINQVLDSLLSNAVEFTEQGSVQLDVTCAQASGAAASIRFSVADTGPGIEPEQQVQLFDAFSQADNSMTREHGGTGLGLALAQKLVQLMQGNITLQSVPGAGSTFSFELMLPITDALPAEVSDNQPLDLTPIRGARILLVDDAPLNLQVAGELLRQAKLIVDTAENGAEAVEKVNAAPYDLVLMDVQMPVMDGYTATRAIRANPQFTALPVLAMTANAMPQDREQGEAAGMNAYIPKPVAPDDLYAALLKWIAPGERDFDETEFAATEPAASVDELPESMPGLNLKEGLARVGGNTTLYLSLLQDLCRDYADAGEQIKATLATGDTDNAAALAHKLRGIAFNLGAGELGAAAQVIEQGIKSGSEVTEQDQAQLAEAIALTRDSQRQLADYSDNESPAEALDAQQRNATFANIVAAVAENNPEALDMAQSLLENLDEAAPGYAEVAAAMAALDMYDFEQAAEQLAAAEPHFSAS